MGNIKYLGPAAIVVAAVLWSFDGLLRQNLSEVPSLLVVLLEHFSALCYLLPFFLKAGKR
jgi:hypothetical protein